MGWNRGKRDKGGMEIQTERQKYGRGKEDERRGERSEVGRMKYN